MAPRWPRLGSSTIAAPISPLRFDAITLPGRVRGVDFGIATEVGDQGLDLTRADMVVGTMQYLPPELLRGLPFGPEDDVHSLGLVLYQCLTGAVPFGDLPGFDSVLRRMEDGVPDLCQAVPDSASLSAG